MTLLERATAFIDRRGSATIGEDHDAADDKIGTLVAGDKLEHLRLLMHDTGLDARELSDFSAFTRNRLLAALEQVGGNGNRICAVLDGYIEVLVLTGYHARRIEQGGELQEVQAERDRLKARAEFFEASAGRYYAALGRVIKIAESLDADGQSEPDLEALAMDLFDVANVSTEAPS